MKQSVNATLEELESKKQWLAGLSEAEEAFLRNWRGLGELRRLATPEEQQRLIRHVIEVVEWKPVSENGKRGTYVIRFFPDAVRQDAGLLTETWAKNDTGPALAGPVSSPVRHLGQKAPQAGLEPATHRLTAPPSNSSCSKV